MICAQSYNGAALLMGFKENPKHPPATECSLCTSIQDAIKEGKILPKEFWGESFAAHHSDQWIGCIACQTSHHRDNFCSCGACFFSAELLGQNRAGYTWVICKSCGKEQIWD